MSAPTPYDVQALVFDVFGTLVDWRSGIVAAGERVGMREGVHPDWGAVADGWRRRYRPALDAVRAGGGPWRNLDDVQRATLAEVLAERGLADLGDRARAELVRAWSELPPWPDSAPGLSALRERFLLATLSNGHLALLARLVNGARLPFDLVLSAELADSYKPDPVVYRTALRLLDLPANRVMMVAAHADDLQAAAGEGLRTAYVHRPLEWGPGTAAPKPPLGRFDLVVDGIDGLARRLDR